jgi:hypothetical protein
MRTDKCKEITKEMSWQERLTEYRKLSTFEEIMSLSSSERVLVSCAMFSAYRAEIIASLPKDLSPSDFKRQLYVRTYGEPLPEDFPLED